MYILVFITSGIGGRDHSSFFVQVCYKTHASGGNNIFLQYHSRSFSYQNYQQSWQKLGIFLENEVFYKSKHFKTFIKVEIV